MQLSPKYGDHPLIVLEGSNLDLATPVVRQRQRLVDRVSTFDAHDWASPSRCEGWSAKDVIIHLDTTNAFWSYSVRAGLRGEPTTLLATFDPVASPAEMVQASQHLADSEVLDRFAATTDTLNAILESLDPSDWSTLAEAPPGHLAIAAVAHHALWDSWIHERDILAPRGEDAPIEADEVAACLRYAAALSPAFSVANGSTNEATLRIEATDPLVHLRVAVSDQVRVSDGTSTEADAHLTGSAVELVEALSSRAELNHDLSEDKLWLVSGLRAVFDQA